MSSTTTGRARTVRFRDVAARTPYWVFTTALAVLFVFPLIWTGVSSVSPHPGTNQVNGWGFGNYVTLANYQAGIGIYILNTAIVSGLTVLLTLVVSTLGGYAFARFRFVGRNALFLLTLAILMVPYATVLIPLYVILTRVGLQNTLLGVALVLTMFQLPFSTFMMRISFEAVPREMDEAAMVDGCTRWQTFYKVILPLTGPGLVATGVYCWILAWNEFVVANTLLLDNNKQTLMVYLLQFQASSTHGADYAGLMAAATLTSLPVVILFVIFQRRITSGLTAGAVKG